jgi:hypothetical protein
VTSSWGDTQKRIDDKLRQWSKIDVEKAGIKKPAPQKERAALIKKNNDLIRTTW